VTKQRPDPDQLLEHLQAEEARARRGRLRIFFGATAGVGKTYAMLEAARAARVKGLDVAIGYVEPHGRIETERLMEGIEQLPLSAAEFLDLRDGVRGLSSLEKEEIRQRVIVDELAHSNLQGGEPEPRHPKRWQDIEELLESGIDVWTTVNVQHLESLNDVVAQITGIKQRETLPDRVFDEAHEVELIDLPPDDLIERLRTGKIYLPWPEEMNRRLTGAITRYHFAPTEQSRQNLLAEGVTDNAIIVTGNTVIDALLTVVDKVRVSPELQGRMAGKFPFLDPNKRMILVTGHRRENFGEGFENICHALKDIVEAYADVEIVYPVHLNPQVQEPVRRILGDTPDVHLIDPQDYLPFVWLMDRSYLIITDSGGVQEEAPSLGRPVLVMRDTTERPEAVTVGTVKLVGTNRKKIVTETGQLLEDEAAYLRMSLAHNPYGDGNGSVRIVESLEGV